MPVSIQLRFVEGKKKSKRKFCSMCVCKFRGKGGGREGGVCNRTALFFEHWSAWRRTAANGWKSRALCQPFYLLSSGLGAHCFTDNLLWLIHWFIPVPPTVPFSPSRPLVNSTCTRYIQTYTHSLFLSLSFCLSVCLVCMQIDCCQLFKFGVGLDHACSQLKFD